MAIDLEAARRIIADVPVPELLVEAQTDLTSPFTAGVPQAAVVGQDIFAFLAETDASLRDILSDSALLAQMSADAMVADKDDVVGWYNAYFSVLKQVGWLVQDGGWSEVSESGGGFEVHEKIMDIATTLLGGAPTALSVISSTLGSLKEASDDNPWITLFHKRAIHGRSARFQLGVVQPAQGGSAAVTMMAFALTATTIVTKVLVFKVTKNRATLRTNSATIGLDLAALRDLAPDIRAQLRGWQRLFIKALPALPAPAEVS